MCVCVKRPSDATSLIFSKMRSIKLICVFELKAIYLISVHAASTSLLNGPYLIKCNWFIHRKCRQSVGALNQDNNKYHYKTAARERKRKYRYIRVFV